MTNDNPALNISDVMEYSFNPADSVKTVDFETPIQARYMRITIQDISAGGINEPLVMNQ